MKNSLFAYIRLDCVSMLLILYSIFLVTKRAPCLDFDNEIHYHLQVMMIMVV